MKIITDLFKGIWRNILKVSQYYPVAIVLVFVILFVVLYFYLPLEKAKDFVTYLSGWATVGILILTTFYVIYTNWQIKEIQKQRQLQMQPLPNIEILEAAITSPKITTFPSPNADISLKVDLHIKYKLKNIGNGVAILTDLVFFTYRQKNKREKRSLFCCQISRFGNRQRS